MMRKKKEIEKDKSVIDTIQEAVGDVLDPEAEEPAPPVEPKKPRRLDYQEVLDLAEGKFVRAFEELDGALKLIRVLRTFE